MWDAVSARVADIVSSYPKTCIFLSVAIAGILTSGLAFAKVETDIRRSFSPHDSDSANEARRYLDFYGLNVYPSRSFILFQTKDPKDDILREESLRYIEAMDAQMTSVLNKVDPVDGLRSCDPVCNINYAFHMFMSELKEERAGNKTSLDSRLFDYPRSRLRGAEIFIGLNIHGTTLRAQPFPGNSSKIVAANTIILHYFSRFDTPQRISDFKNRSLGLFFRSQEHNTSSLVDFSIFGEEIANHEMVRGAFENNTKKNDGPIGCNHNPDTNPGHIRCVWIPMLRRLQNLLNSMRHSPFLVLGIGVDDAFILVHWWNHYKNIKNRDARMRKVLVDVGPSITITSLTNIVAFGVGFLTPTPQMSMFCLCTSIALFFDYIITYSILAPVVYLCQKDKTTSETAIAPIKAPTPAKETRVTRAVRAYSRVICSTKGKLISGVILLGVYAFCTVGVLSVRSTFDPSKAFPADSVLVKAVKKIQPVFNEFFPLHIYVSNPPNITNKQEYATFHNLVDDLESLPMVYSDNKTVIFLNQYEQYDHHMSNLLSSLFMAPQQTDYPLTLHNLGSFLDIIGNPPTIKYKRPQVTGGEGDLEAFAFTIIAKGMHEWGERAKYEEMVRQMLKKYSQFNATLFDADSAVLAVILTTRDDLIGSICLTVACMACVCVLFISNKWGVAIVTAVISSICFCLVGMLSWWGVDMDPVMQVDVLLATGFSVDYTAHIAYQYYQNRGRPEERVYASLIEMASPMLQAGMSTVLCMLPLIFIKTYTIVCFAKTIFIVVGFGLYHGLVVLPALLSFTAKEEEKPTPALINEPLLEMQKKNEAH
ncbi:unnamed protein product, partial [Mesorhabditis spiculigera]